MNKTRIACLTLILGIAAIAPAQIVLDAAAGESTATLLGEAESQALGTALAVGNLDGNAALDLVIGAPGDAAANGDPGAGAVYVIFDAASLAGEQAVSLAASFVMRGAVGDPNGQFGDGLGTAVLVADLDGDTVGDLIAGAPGSRGPLDRPDAGEVIVLYGPLSPGSVDLAVDPPGHRIQGEGLGDRIGGALAAGQVTGADGLELLLGIPAADGDSDALQTSGEGVLLGFTPLPPLVIDLGAGPVLVRIRGESPGDAAGQSVALADLVFDDGLADVILGAPGTDGPQDNRGEAGAVYVIDGAFRPPIPINLGPGVADILVHGARGADAAGATVATGDFDGDTFRDLAVGAPGGDGPGPAFNRNDAGQVHLLYLDTQPRLQPVDLFQEGVQTRIFGADDGHRLALSLAAGRGVPGGGDTLISGVPFEDGPDGTRRNAGAGIMIGTLPARPPFFDLAVDDPDLILHGAEFEERLGVRVALGDLNGDGAGDLVVGAPFAEAGGIPGAGLVRLVLPSFPNRPPVAVADVPALVGCATGGTATVPLEGAGSSDPDDDIVAWRWYDTVVQPANLIATGETTSADLPVGSTDIVLEVEDSVGQTSTDTRTVTVEESAGPVTMLRVRRPAGGSDLEITWSDAPCAATHRIFRGNLAALPAYDHQTPFTGDPGMPECSAASGVALPGEGLWMGGVRSYYLVGGVNAPAGSDVVGTLGAADLDADGVGESQRPRPGQGAVTDACP